MNLSYKFNQLINLLNKPDGTKQLTWVFIYGLPRSGTTLLLQSFMKQAKAGIGDWDLREIQRAINYYEHSSYIALNTKLMVQQTKENIIRNAPPGGGNRYDLIVKQIDTNQRELDFLIRLFGKEPEFKLFCFREPNGWLPSAKKKFNISDAEAELLYQRCFNSFSEIGGLCIEYDDLGRFHEINPHFQFKIDDFERQSKAKHPDGSLTEVYTNFKKALVNKPIS